jgi:hypothetical protein
MGCSPLPGQRANPASGVTVFLRMKQAAHSPGAMAGLTAHRVSSLLKNFERRRFIQNWAPARGADHRPRGRRIFFMDLRLRSNEAAARFSMKPSGLRSFWLRTWSLPGHRSQRICSLPAPRTKPKILSAVASEFFNRLPGVCGRDGPKE